MMSLTQYYTAATLDGFIADPNHSLDWLFTRQQDRSGPLNYAASSPASARSRWARRRTSGSSTTSSPARTGRVELALQRAVLGLHAPAAPGRAGRADRVREGDVVPVHEAMVAAAGGRNVWVVGGGDLAGQFADAGLLDEVIVYDRAGDARRRCAAAPAPDRAATGGTRTERRVRLRPILGRDTGRGRSPGATNHTGWSAAMTEHAVVIAGGGPTGLMLAGELALAGVDVADRRAARQPGARRLARRRPARTHDRDPRSARHRRSVPSQGQVAQVAGFAMIHARHQRLPHSAPLRARRCGRTTSSGSWPGGSTSWRCRSIADVK